MERILVLGGCGAGKSTFARSLATSIGLPVVHLDQHYHLPGWKETPADAWLRRVEELIAAPRWIIDGSYQSTLSVRLARADTAIVLDFPTWLCFLRVLRRIATTYGRVRPDSAAGCPEQLDLSFLWFVLRFRATRRPRAMRDLAAFRGHVVTLRTPREVRRFLRSVSG